MQRVAAGFYGEIEIIAIGLLCYPLDYSPINCVYRFFIQHFESGNEAIRYKSEQVDIIISKNQVLQI